MLMFMPLLLFMLVFQLGMSVHAWRSNALLLGMSGGGDVALGEGRTKVGFVFEGAHADAGLR